MKSIPSLLLTGSSSPVGRTLVKLLAQRYFIYAHSHRSTIKKADNLAPIRSDLKDGQATKKLLRKVKKLDVIIHLAGTTDAHVAQKLGDYSDNQAMARTIVEIAKSKKVKIIIFLSSNSVNYSQRLYAQSKAEAEDIIKKSHVPFIIFRPTLILSDRSPEIKTLSRLIQKLPLIPLADHGVNTIRPVRAIDVAKAIFLAMNNPQATGKTYTLSGDSAISFNDIVTHLMTRLQLSKPVINIPSVIVKIVLLPLKVFHNDLANIVQDSFLHTVSGDNELAKTELGWKPGPVTSQTIDTNFR